MQQKATVSHNRNTRANLIFNRETVARHGNFPVMHRVPGQSAVSVMGCNETKVILSRGPLRYSGSAPSANPKRPPHLGLIKAIDC
jgi:hypothetical protein